MFRTFRDRTAGQPARDNGGRRATGQRRRASRPALEALEDRLVLSTFFVTNSSDNLQPGSLRYAITQANLPGNAGSTVEITSQVTGPIVLHNGELPVDANMTILNDSGAPLEIRQATPHARVIEVGPAVTAMTIDGTASTTPITLDGGSVIGANGGGILVDGSATALRLNHVDVVSNVGLADSTGAGGNGGGIYAAGGKVTLSDSSVNDNQAPDGKGGGINMAVGTVVVENGSHVDGNSARNVGGICVGQVVRPRDDAVDVTGGSTVNGNQSTATVDPDTGDFGGGGIAAESTGNVYVSDSQVSHNR
jgi:hypothetical protein